MEVLTYRPDPAEFAWTFGGVPPVRRVRPGSILELWTEDAFGGRVRGPDDLVSRVVEFPFVNPQTGPFYVEGAEPGDTLAVHFVSIEPSVTFRARRGELVVELPLDPMHGTVGVAPASFEARSSLVPDAHGGNMDTPEMRAGVTCYLGVNVEGALLSIGDGHCRQGEGESCGVAVEAAMDTVIAVDLVKGMAAPWPRLESDTHMMSTGSARPLEDAFRISQVDLVQWLQEGWGLDPLDAYQLLTQAAEAPVANVVDPNYTFVSKLRKDLLPAQELYRGTHGRLRQLGRDYLAGKG